MKLFLVTLKSYIVPIVIIAGLITWINTPFWFNSDIFTPFQVTAVKTDTSTNTYSEIDVFNERPVSFSAEVRIFGTLSSLSNKELFSELSAQKTTVSQTWLTHISCTVEVDSECTPTQVENLKSVFTGYLIAGIENDQTQTQQTFTNLQNSFIQFAGNPDPSIQEDICESISIPLNAEYTNNAENSQQFSLPIAICSFSLTEALNTNEIVKQIETYSQQFLTIVIPYGENSNTQFDETKMLYDAIRSIGVEAIIPAGQTIDNRSQESLTSFAIQQENQFEIPTYVFSISFPYSKFTSDYTAIAKDCFDFRDICHITAKKQKVTPPLFTTSIIPESFYFTSQEDR